MFWLSRTRIPFKYLRPSVQIPRRRYAVRYVRFDQPGGPSNRRPKFFDNNTWPMKVGAGIGLLMGLYYIEHIEEVPETGRRRFMNVSKETEAELAAIALKQTTHEFHDKILPPNHPLSIHVRKVARKIITASHLGWVKGDEPLISSIDDPWSAPSTAPMSPLKEWNVFVIDDPKFINAFASPGVVCVATGILPICKDEQGLAAVLGHEIGHAALRHTAEKVSSQTVLISFLFFINLLGFGFDLASMAGQLLYELPNSRTLEHEADTVGLRMMARACYDPQAAPEVFARLHEVESRMGRRVPQFLSTHPASADRVDELKRQLPAAYDILASTPDCAQIRDEYEQFKGRTREIRIRDVSELW